MGILAEKNENIRMIVSDTALEDLLAADMMHKLFAPHAAGQVFSWRGYLTQDSETIRYRRSVIQELAALPALVAALRALCECVSMITRLKDSPESEYGPEAFREFALLSDVYDQMRSVCDLLSESIGNGAIHSEALIALRELLQEKIRRNFSPDFEAAWKEYTSGLEQMRSLCVTFELDDELHIRSVSGESVGKERYEKTSLFHRRNANNEKPWELAPLKGMTSPVSDLLESLLHANQRAFRQLLSRMTLDMDDFYQDLIFYLGCLEFCRLMQKRGVELCFPSIREGEDRSFTASGMINPVLVLINPDQKPVGNDIDFGKTSELFLLTGINQGGKTTFLRTVAMIQLLFQLGWPVPAHSASLSLVDRIVTVFSHEEDTGLSHGKLGQELLTMKQGLKEATPDSLFLCNEPITGTSPMENLYLSRIILTSCKVNGLKGIWVTHLYDLASRAQAMNEELPGSTISSLIAKVDLEQGEVNASYHIVRGEPAFTSYAREVIEKEARRK